MSTPIHAEFPRRRQVHILYPDRVTRAMEFAHTSPLEGRAERQLPPQKASKSARSSATASAIGGALDGRPRQSSILRIASGGFIAAMIRIRAPQHGHSRTSTEKPFS